MMVSMVLKH